LNTTSNLIAFRSRPVVKRTGQPKSTAPTESVALAVSFFATALKRVAAVMREGRAKHPNDDWRVYPAEYHLGRARRHLYLLNRGDTTELHLEHAVTRLLMALQSKANGK
jgi:Domain of unknown function (DUF5664)